MWEKSQVILYRLKNLEKVGTSKNAKIEAVGNCFGTLISDKHVLTKANCVLEKKGDARKVNKKDKYIVSLVHFSVNDRSFIFTFGQSSFNQPFNFSFT